MRGFLFFLFSICCKSIVLSQSAIVPIGGNIISSDGQIAYSIGIVNFETIEDQSLSINQGVQYAFELMNNTIGLDESTYIPSIIYPNPAIDKVYFNANSLTILNGSYRIVDMNGRIISSGKLSKEQSIISVSNLSEAIYYLSILDGSVEVAGFQIIKVNSK